MKPFFYFQNYFSAWDQTDKFVKIYLTSLSGLDQLANEAIKTEFTDNSLSVRSVGQVIRKAPSCRGCLRLALLYYDLIL
jgi:hypothetical protein